MSKPALLVVNKMDLPDAEDKLAELKEQLQNPEGQTRISTYEQKNHLGEKTEDGFLLPGFTGVLVCSKHFSGSV